MSCNINKYTVTTPPFVISRSNNSQSPPPWALGDISYGAVVRPANEVLEPLGPVAGEGTSCLKWSLQFKSAFWNALPNRIDLLLVLFTNGIPHFLTICVNKA